MLYCPRCSLLAEGTCPQCGGKVREPRENDPVLFARTDALHAAMLEPLLEEEQIPKMCIRDRALAAVRNCWARARLRWRKPCGTWRGC